MICPYCKQEIGQSTTSKFCPKCGHRLIRCATCGTILTGKEKYCLVDGTKVPDELLQQLAFAAEEEATATAAPAAAAATNPAAPTPSTAAATMATAAAIDATVRVASSPNNMYASGRGLDDLDKTVAARRLPADRAAVQPGPQVNYSQRGPQPSYGNRRPQPHYDNRGQQPYYEQPPYFSEPPKRDPLKPVLIGIIIFLLLLILGLGGYFVANILMSDSSSKESAKTESTQDDEKDTKDEEKASADDTDKDADDSDNSKKKTEEKSDKPAAEDVEDVEEDAIIYASATKSNRSAFSGMNKAKISKVACSSVVQDNGPQYNNYADMMVDGNTETSWQEGADGDGIGEWVRFTFKKNYKVSYITFNMGNWRTKELFNQNNRPHDVILRMGAQEYNLSFPDGMNEYMVEFSDPLPASDLYLEIASVYKGSEWDDTCISEMTVYVE